MMFSHLEKVIILMSLLRLYLMTLMIKPRSALTLTLQFLMQSIALVRTWMMKKRGNRKYQKI